MNRLSIAVPFARLESSILRGMLSACALLVTLSGIQEVRGEEGIRWIATGSDGVSRVRGFVE